MSFHTFNMAEKSATNDNAVHYPTADSPIGNIASLQDKVSLITGASSGLGRSIAQAYAAAGAYVVNADIEADPPCTPNIASLHKSIDQSTPTVDLINSKWPTRKSDMERASFVKCDVSDEDSVKDAVAFTVKKYGRLDIMVNNAGISAELRASVATGNVPRIHETDVSVLERTYQINIKGVWLGTKHSIAQFLSQEPHPTHGKVQYGATEDTHRGWIVNMASIAGSIGIPTASSYCMSKGAVLQLTKTTALEYARDGIHINAIQPGYVDTALIERMYGNAGVDAMHQDMARLHPWGRTGRPEDIARVAVFLAGEGATFVTGQGLLADGGYVAQ